jgi:hypothetical protein
VSAELDFGAGAPYTEQFPGLKDLSTDEMINATEHAILTAMREVGAELGDPPLIRASTGIGAWENFTNVSTQLTLLADEAATDVAAALGYLLQQTEVWSGRSLKMTPKGNLPAAATHWFIDIVAPDGSLESGDSQIELWGKILARMKGEIINLETAIRAFKAPRIGFSPTELDGTTALRIYIPFRDSDGNRKPEGASKAANAQAALAEIYLAPIVEAGADVAFDLDVEYHPGLVDASVNNWKEQPDGQGHLERFADRPAVVERLRSARGAVERSISASIERASATREDRVAEPAAQPSVGAVGRQLQESAVAAGRGAALGVRGADKTLASSDGRVTRGFIDFTRPRDGRPGIADIWQTKDANLTTIIHELSHFFVLSTEHFALTTNIEDATSIEQAREIQRPTATH